MISSLQYRVRAYSNISEAKYKAVEKKQFPVG